MTILSIVYNGEHLLPGIIGQSFIYLAFITALISSVLYILSEVKHNDKLRIIGRTLFFLHFISLLVVSASFFYILLNNYFEYAYVWKHTATYLPLKYIISSFWAGQEGSFLLWVLIEGLLGMVLLFTSKKFESKVMAVLGAGQFFLTTMILGIKPLGFILGQSPFSLLREEANNIGSQFFQNPDYLSQIIDGNGINPLLENIWMVTHPPLLFLGYSASIIPFAFAIASLWSGDFKTWLKPAFPWTIFSVLTLGGGILLGGAWAYESLTFGGFWAWDPVENASLIPWLIILAGMHMMILNKKRNHSFGLSYIFLILGYTLVLYASYLTRSGVLGSTSVHAFGNNGLSTQMVLIMAIVIITSFFLYFKNYKKFPKNDKDEFLSREFWMYIGSLILVLSSFQVFISTSIPVINKVFGTNIAPPMEVVAYYNKWQLPLAILIVIFISVSMVLKYGKNDLSSFLKRFGIVIIAANVLFIPEIYIFEIDNLAFLIFLFTINLAIVSSFDYLIRNKFSFYNLSNSVSHFGFALFLLGVLVAFSNSQIISKNTSMYNLGDAESNKENQLLEKDKLKQLNNYLVQYSSLRKEQNHLYYGIDFYTKNKDGKLDKEFSIEPTINVNSIMGNVYNPDTYHSLKKDVFTYISYADIKADETDNRYKKLSETEMVVGDTLTVNKDIFILKDIRIEGSKDSIDVNNVSIIATIAYPTSTDSITSFDIGYRIKDGVINKDIKDIPSKKLRFRFVNISTKKMGMILGIERHEMQFIVIKSVIFPYISLLWIGALIMLVGLFISLYRNIKSSVE